MMQRCDRRNFDENIEIDHISKTQISAKKVFLKNSFHEKMKEMNMLILDFSKFRLLYLLYSY